MSAQGEKDTTETATIMLHLGRDAASDVEDCRRILPRVLHELERRFVGPGRWESPTTDRQLRIVPPMRPYDPADAHSFGQLVHTASSSAGERDFVLAVVTARSPSYEVAVIFEGARPLTRNTLSVDVSPGTLVEGGRYEDDLVEAFISLVGAASPNWGICVPKRLWNQRLLASRDSGGHDVRRSVIGSAGWLTFVHRSFHLRDIGPGDSGLRRIEGGALLRMDSTLGEYSAARALKLEAYLASLA